MSLDVTVMVAMQDRMRASPGEVWLETESQTLSTLRFQFSSQIYP